MIMYVCEECYEHSPESCGHYDRREIHITLKGKWICQECYEYDEDNQGIDWKDLPMPSEYIP